MQKFNYKDINIDLQTCLSPLIYHLYLWLLHCLIHYYT